MSTCRTRPRDVLETIASEYRAGRADRARGQSFRATVRCGGWSYRAGWLSRWRSAAGR